MHYERSESVTGASRSKMHYGTGRLRGFVWHGIGWHSITPGASLGAAVGCMLSTAARRTRPGSSRGSTPWGNHIAVLAAASTLPLRSAARAPASSWLSAAALLRRYAWRAAGRPGGRSPHPTALWRAATPYCRPAARCHAGSAPPSQCRSAVAAARVARASFQDAFGQPRCSGVRDSPPYTARVRWLCPQPRQGPPAAEGSTYAA